MEEPKGLCLTLMILTTKQFLLGSKRWNFKNTNISIRLEWTLVTKSIPQNIAVSSLAYDPNNTQIFYAGTGESYTAGDALGNGLWQSKDGGDTWNKVFGGDTDNPSTFISEPDVVEIIDPSTNRTYNYGSADYGPPVPPSQLLQMLY